VVAAIAIPLALTFRTSATNLPTAIAVLPLVNLNTDPDSEFFADGLTGEIIHELGAAGGLRVSSQTSSFALNVGAIVEGSVLRQGQRVRIIAQLVQVPEDRQLWSGKFDRDISDIVSLQAEVAREIVDRLKAHLPERASRAAIHRPDPEAYELYLRGRYFLNQWNASAALKSVDYLKKACARDPGFAAAHAALAFAYRDSGWYAGSPSAGLHPLVRSEAEQAIALDPACAEARVSAAYVKWFFEWNWPAAEREYERAMELNPNLADGWAGYGQVLALQGRDAESTDKLKRALELDPLSLPLMYRAAESHYWARRYDEALRLCRQIEKADPRFNRAVRLIGLILLERKEYAEAIRLLDPSSLRTVPSRVPVPAMLGYAYAVSGRRQDALHVLDVWQKTSAERPLPPGGMMRIYLGLGDQAHALEWLEKAYAERDNDTLVDLKVTPTYDAIRGDPRFVAILRKVGLTP
jgi:TolB-like protein/Tfp pilus assembly protein PilF